MSTKGRTGPEDPSFSKLTEVFEHFFEISVALDFAAVFGTEFRRVELA